jgi:hypothetical protein
MSVAQCRRAAPWPADSGAGYVSTGCERLRQECP